MRVSTGVPLSESLRADGHRVHTARRSTGSLARLLLVSAALAGAALLCAVPAPAGAQQSDRMIVTDISVQGHKHQDDSTYWNDNDGFGDEIVVVVTAWWENAQTRVNGARLIMGHGDLPGGLGVTTVFENGVATLAVERDPYAGSVTVLDDVRPHPMGALDNPHGPEVVVEPYVIRPSLAWDNDPPHDVELELTDDVDSHGGDDIDPVAGYYDDVELELAAGAGGDGGGSGVPENAFSFSVDGCTWGRWRQFPETSIVCGGDGEQTARVRVRDHVDNVAAVEARVVVDSQPPPAPVLECAPSRAILYDLDGTVGVSWGPCSDPNSMYYRVVVPEAGIDATQIENSITWTGDDGDTFELTVWAYDLAGNASLPARLRVAVDLYPPEAPELEPLDEYTAGRSVALTWSDEAASGASEYWVEVSRSAAFTKLDGESGWIDGTDFTFDGLEHGVRYHYRVRCRDLAGHESVFSRLRSSTQDAYPPTLTLVALSDGGIVDENVAEGRCMDDLSGVDWAELVVGGESIPLALDPLTGVFLAEGPLSMGENSLSFRAEDKAGNLTVTRGIQVLLVSSVERIGKGESGAVYSEHIDIEVPDRAFGEPAWIAVTESPASALVSEANEKAGLIGRISCLSELTETQCGISAVKYGDFRRPIELIGDREATVTIRYGDCPVPERLATDVVPYVLNTEYVEWQQLPAGSIVSSSPNAVQFTTDSFTFFRLGVPFAPAALAGDFRAFPLPFRPSLGHQEIFFAGLGRGARVEVYTLTGARVARLSDDAGGTISWNASNLSGNPLASGIYLYRALDDEGRDIAGKIVVVK